MITQTRTFKGVARESSELSKFLQPFYSLPCTHFWRGYGSAMFLEFGELSYDGLRRDGTRRNPAGEWNLYLDYNWRVEGKRLIWCGSEAEEEHCAPTFQRLLGRKVHQLSFEGRLPELNVKFENRLHLLTLTTDAGDPGWSLMEKVSNGYQALCSRKGQLVLETCVESNA